MTPQLHPHRSSSYTDEELWSQQFSASLALTVPELVNDAAGGLISSPGSVRWLVGCSWTTTTPKAQPGHPQNPQPLPKVTAVPCVQSSHAGQHGAQPVHWGHTGHSHRLFAFKGMYWKSLTTSLAFWARTVLVFNKLPAPNGYPLHPHQYSSPQHGLIPMQIWLLLPKPLPCCSTWQSHQRLDKPWCSLLISWQHASRNLF